jgi:DNA repair protein RadC
LAGQLHSGHRQRAKAEFLSRGLEGLPDHRVLELILFYALPQGDVNPLAHRLIDQFGSLAGVLDATAEQLTSVPGVGQHTAVLLKLFPAVGGRYLQGRTALGDLIETSWDIRNLFTPYFFGARNEMAYLACLDAKHKLLGVRKLGEGSVNAAEITSRKVVEAALALNTSVVILAHNHTSGIATPSHEDLLTTRHLFQLLQQVGIQLYDHVILVDDDMLSLRDSGIFSTL